MEFSRQRWSSPLTGSAAPGWMCPTCEKASLVPLWKTLSKRETHASKDAHGHDDWEPDWRTDLFSLQMRCAATDCNETVVVAGKTRWIMRDYSGGSGPDYDEVYEPEYVSPSPALIHVPSALPEKLRGLLRDAFRLYWADRSACLARIRAFVEKLLTERRIPVTAQGKNGRVRLALHHRIEKLKATNPNVADSLLAIKWLGNAGAHDAIGASQKDALDAFEILQDALLKLYSSNTTAKLVTAVNARKGPVPSRRKRKRKRKRKT